MDSALLTIHIDGAARGNPGPAAYAYVIARDGQPTVEASECLGHATNNVAEYTALVKALARAAALKGKRLLIHSDSELLVKQMNGVYRVKNPDLQTLYQEAKELTREFDTVTIRHVRREQNSRADYLGNEALDGRPVSADAEAEAEAAPVESPPKGKKALPAAAQEEARQVLHTAAAAWGAAAPRDPSVEEVLARIIDTLDKHRLMRKR